MMAPSGTSGKAEKIKLLQDRINHLEGASADARPSSNHATESQQGEPHLGSNKGENHEGTGKDAQSAFLRIIRLSANRERCKSILYSRLLDDGYREEDIQEAMERAVQAGIVNDERYARCYARARISAGYGMLGIERELRRMDIPEESIRLALGEAACEGCDDELSRALAYLQKHPPRSKNLRDGAYRKLAGKGFSADIASSAARQWTESQT